MPELPEVETVRLYLDAQLPGARVQGATLRREDLRYPIPVPDVHALAGSEMRALRRRAKYLLLDFSTQRTALVHLGMSGRLFVTAAQEPWQLHEHWRLHLQRQGQALDLRYVDARRFGCLDVLDTSEEERHPLLASLGPEPLSDAFDAAAQHALSQGRHTPLKIWLMDSHNVVGVGNIYASEACFRARLHPLRAVGELDLGDWQRIVASVRSVLQEAILAGGSTLRDFVGGDAKPGYFQQQLSVYARDGQPCPLCAAPIQRAVLATRATFWCSRCQG